MDKLDVILQKMDSMVQKMDTMEQKMDTMEQKMDTMEQKMDTMEQKMGSMEQKMDSMERKVDSMQTDIGHLKEESVKLNLRMDNEIVFGLKAVADGHADLERLLIHFLDDRYSREQLSIRLVHLASEIHQINRRCTRCA